MTELPIVKKHFHLRKADVVIKDKQGVVIETRTVTTKAGKALIVDLEECYYGMLVEGIAPSYSRIRKAKL